MKKLIPFQRVSFSNKIWPILFIIPLLVLTSCHSTNRFGSQTAKEQFDWLIGNWQRRNEKPDRATYEQWQKVSLNEYQGIGFTMQNGDTLKQEKLWLKKKNSRWNLMVIAPGDKQVTTFPVVAITDSSFTTENLKHDFPTHIQYWKAGDLLKARVYNTEMSIDFEFRGRKSHE